MATPASKVEVRLSADQRATLQRLARTGTHPAHARRRAAILLEADAAGPDAWADDRIAEALEVSRDSGWRVRARFAAEGLDATLHKKKTAGSQGRKLDGAQEARLVALACSKPPDGEVPLDDDAAGRPPVELEVVASIHPATVWRTLQKTTSRRG